LHPAARRLDQNGEQRRAPEQVLPPILHGALELGIVAVRRRRTDVEEPCHLRARLCPEVARLDAPPEHPVVDQPEELVVSAMNLIDARVDDGRPPEPDDTIGTQAPVKVRV
jgi:hypothetical protein